MEIDNVKYNCVEQYMMAMKARLFGDHESLKNIILTENPKLQKQYGREVKGFNQSDWESVSYQIIVCGSVEKYRQNSDLKKLLEETGDLELVEASPYDNIWGIGLEPNNPDALDKSKWRGKNLLGKAITEARTILRNCNEAESLGFQCRYTYPSSFVEKFKIKLGEI
jgi:hypothetical protein